MTQPRSSLLIATGVVLVLVGCSHNPPPTQPPPAQSRDAVHQPVAGPSNATADPDAARRAEAERRARERAANTAELVSALTARVHFDFNQAVLKQEELALLDRKAGILMANPGVQVRIAGNADERGSDEYNLVLGMERATAAKQYLIVKGVDASRIDLVSWGEEHPIDSGHGEDAWTKNRRDEFEIVAGSPTTVP